MGIEVLCQKKWISGEVDNCILLADIEGSEILVKQNFAYALCRYITEVQKDNGKEYPPNSLRDLLYCLQMYLETKRVYWKLIDKTDDQFMDVAMVLDNKMKKRVAKGMGLVQSAEPISVEMENKM